MLTKKIINKFNSYNKEKRSLIFTEFLESKWNFYWPSPLVWSRMNYIWYDFCFGKPFISICDISAKVTYAFLASDAMVKLSELNTSSQKNDIIFHINDKLKVSRVLLLWIGHVLFSAPYRLLTGYSILPTGINIYISNILKN